MVKDTRETEMLEASNSGFHIGDISSSFAPTSPMARLLSATTIDPNTTATLTGDNLRLAKFMKSVFSTGFSDLQEVTQQDGDIWYTAVETIEGQEFSFHISRNEIISSFSLSLVTNDVQIEERSKKYKIDAKDTYIIINGKKYFLDLSIPLYFGTSGEGTILSMIAGGAVSGTSLIAGLLIPVLEKSGVDAIGSLLRKLTTGVLKTLITIITNILKIVYQFFATLIIELISGQSVTEALAAARIAVSAAEGIVSGVEVSTVLLGITGIIILIAIFLFAIFILHKTYQIVTIYNLTDHDLHISFPYYYNGTPPAPGSVPTVIKGATEKKTASGSLGKWYNAVGFLWQSNGVFTGLGYAIELRLADSTMPDSKKFAAMFDIPFVGQNSLYSTTQSPSDYHKFYLDHEGVYKQQIYSDSDQQFEIIVTYDYIEGKHKNPETGQDAFLYNSMIIIRNAV